MESSTRSVSTTLSMTIFRKLSFPGDIYYVRGWTLEDTEEEVAEGEGPANEAEEGREPKTSIRVTRRHIPCWILLSVTNSTSTTEKMSEESMTVTIFDISLMLRVVGEYSTEEQKIQREIFDILDVRIVGIIMIMCSNDNWSVYRDVAFVSINGFCCKT